MTRYVGFLRGINVGKAKRLAMADLREMCEELGLEGVRTQGQSGNLVFDSTVSARRLESQIGDAIRRRLGMDVVVVVRTASQLAAVIERNPFEKLVTVPKYSTVSFLAAARNVSPFPDGFQVRLPTFTPAFCTSALL